MGKGLLSLSSSHQIQILSSPPRNQGAGLGLTESEVEWERMLQANMDALDDPNKLPEVAWPKELLYRFQCATYLCFYIL